jgi:hypothetical protein
MLTEVKQDPLNARRARELLRARARGSPREPARWPRARRAKRAGTLAPTRMPASQNLDALSNTKEVPCTR